MLVQDVVEGLIAQGLENSQLLERPELDLVRLGLCPPPNGSLEDISLDGEEDALRGSDDWEDLAHLTHPAIEGVVADDVARRVLGDVLVFEGVLLVVPQDDPAVEDDMEVSLVVKDDVTPLLLDDSEL